MASKIYWIHQFADKARLGIMARPRGDDWLEEEIENLKKRNVDNLVSLLAKDEVFELGLQKEEVICKSHNITFINFPIPDRGVPKTDDKVDNILNHLINKIKEGNSVVIHCRMGIGRSSIIAASILLKTGFNADDAINLISQVRGLKVPDTEQQLAWLKLRAQKS
jgi:protein-tyrosine phosphatase